MTPTPRFLPHRVMPMPHSKKTVPIVVYDGAKLLDITGPMQVFADAALPDGQPAYQTFLVSQNVSSVISDTGLELPTTPIAALTRRKIHTLLIAGGNSAPTACRDTALVRSIRHLARRADRIGSVCSGALILAETGLLAGKRAVTHWEAAEHLQAMHPNTIVELDPIYLKDGNVWTSAGVTSGIDLALAMVAEDLGRHAALKLAKRLVMYMARPGGQAQFSAMLHLQNADTSGRFDKLHEWMLGHLNTDLKVERLAERMHMSARTFARSYRKHTGSTPAKAVEAMRLEAARMLLEDTDQPVTSVARNCGFGDEERMRRAFLRRFRVSPAAYRSRFRAA